MDEQSGAYGGWTRLTCWRVPSKIWLGLPDPEENRFTYIDGHVLDSNCMQQADAVLKRSKAYDKIQ